MLEVALGAIFAKGRHRRREQTSVKVRFKSGHPMHWHRFAMLSSV
jgi:hypothetical protein